MRGRQLPHWNDFALYYIAKAISSLAEMGSILVKWTSSTGITDGPWRSGEKSLCRPVEEGRVDGFSAIISEEAAERGGIRAAGQGCYAGAVVAALDKGRTTMADSLPLPEARGLYMEDTCRKSFISMCDARRE